MKIAKSAVLNRIFILLILVITAIFILKLILNYSAGAGNAITQINIYSIISSFVLYLSIFYFRALSWDYLLKSFGYKLDFKKSLSIWFYSESTRYIPGSIWSFASRLYLVSKEKVPKSITLAAMTLEILFLISSTSIFSIPGLQYASKTLSFNPIGIVLFTIFLTFILLIIVLYDKTKNLISRIKFLHISIYKSKDIYLSFVFQSLSRLSFGLGTYTLIQSLNPSLNPIIFTSVCLLAWLIGYLSFITPMGLGIREATLILLLSPVLGVGEATLLSLLSRIILVIAESTNIICWFWFVQRRRFISLMTKLIKRWDLFLLGVFILSYVVIFSTLSILRHNAFASGYDLANMDQTIWNTIHGRIFVMSSAEGNISRLATHADLILILLAPLYLLWDNVRILLIVQSLFLGLGAIPAYLLAKKILKNKILSLSLSSLYLLNPGMEWTNIYDFHGVALAIPLLLATFYFAYSQKWKWYWVFFTLSLITKEEISLFLAMMGILIVVFLKNKKIGLISFFIGIIWFLSMVFIAIPLASPNNQHWAFNGWFKTSKDELDRYDFTSLINDTISNSKSERAINYYALLLKPFGFLPLLGIPWLLMALPELIINFLSQNTIMQSIILHYDSGITPALVISTIFALSYIKLAMEKLFTSGRLNIFLSLMLLLIAVRVNYHYSPLPTTPSCWCYIYQVSNDDIQFEKILQNLPEDATIIASGEIRPHLTHRQTVLNMPIISPEADYIALIDQERSIGNFSPHAVELNLINEFSKQNSLYKLQERIGHFYLFKRDFQLSI